MGWSLKTTFAKHPPMQEGVLGCNNKLMLASGEVTLSVMVEVIVGREEAKHKAIVTYEKAKHDLLA